MSIVEQKNEFLYNSINDLQSTIRAIDIKISFLLVILLLFVSKLNSIYNIFNFWVNFNSKTIGVSLTIINILFIISWILAFILALRVLVAIDEPSSKITGTPCQSFFYPAFLFTIKWSFVLFCCESKSNQSLNEYKNTLPETVDQITEQLALEQMKLTYIANLKLKRSQAAFNITICWIILGGIIWSAYIFAK